MNGQITTVNSKTGDHLGSMHIVFLFLFVIDRNIRQIRQNFAISAGISENLKCLMAIHSHVTEYHSVSLCCVKSPCLIYIKNPNDFLFTNLVCLPF